MASKRLIVSGVAAVLLGLCGIAPGQFTSVPAPRGSGGSGGSIDNPSWGIFITTGGGSEVAYNWYAVQSPAGWTLDGCSFSLTTAPTVSNAVVDIQTSAAVSIFGATKLVIPVGASSPALVSQGTFATSPMFLPLGTLMRASVAVGGNDGGAPFGAAQGGHVHCWGH